MAATKLLFNQARRQCLYRIQIQTQTQTQLRPPPFFSYLSKSLSSSSEEAPIQPVSYTPKPQTDEEPHLSSEPNTESPPPPPPRQEDGFAGSLTEEIQKAWTREDLRYVKDTPSITPVAYPVRVAPLPEYKAPEPEPEEEIPREKVEREARRIYESTRVMQMRREVFRLKEEEEVRAPMPTLIKKEMRPKREPLDLMDAIKNAKANAKAKFDETIEVHAKLGVDPKRSDLIVRGSVLLPHSLGKVVRVAFFAAGEDAEEARAAGAEVVGGEELIEEIFKSGGKVNFDRCYTTPQFMPRIGKLGRILGPRGLMPTAKQGLVSSNITGAVLDAKKGHISYRMDKSSNVHVGLGKASFEEEILCDNICAFVHSLLLAKPLGLKKTSKYAGYLNAFHICSTMGPGYPISIQSLSKAVDNFTTANVN